MRFLPVYTASVLLFSSCTYERCKEEVVKSVLPKEYTGWVDSTYIDSEDHMSPIVVLENHNKIYLNYFSENCVETIRRGDYIKKKKDSTFIKVYRGEEKFIFYPVCDGREIKSVR